MTDKQEAAVAALVEASKPEAIGNAAAHDRHADLRTEALRLACGDNCTITDGSDTLALARSYALFLIEGR